MKAMRRFCAALIAALACAAPHAIAAPAVMPALGDADRQCLGCHGEAGIEKSFAQGDTVSLHVDAAAFAKSMHAALGCAACHGDVDLQKHPAASPFKSSRAFAVAMSQSCRGCHESSVDAHAKSVHASDSGPLCATCHTSHGIQRASSALREACLGCHQDAQARHANWLPNAKTHFNVVACAACHAPGAGKRVELRFYDVKAKSEMVFDGQAMPSMDKPVDPSQLRSLVHAVEDGGGDNVLLMGRVEPLEQGAGHRILSKSQAVKECATCHRKGADPFQNVTLSIVGPDGTRTRFEAQHDVLNSPTSVDSVRGFYAMGGTRIQALDIMLGLALAGGISAPLGHLAMRWLMRRKEARK